MLKSQPNDSNKEDTDKNKSKKQVSSRFTRLKKAFTDSLTEAYIKSLISAHPLFILYNLILQSTNPVANFVYHMTKDLTHFSPVSHFYTP